VQNCFKTQSRQQIALATSDKSICPPIALYKPIFKMIDPKEAVTVFEREKANEGS